MRTYLKSIVYKLHQSFWFLPALMGLLAVFSVPLVLQLDEQQTSRDILRVLPLPRMTVDGARQMLTSIAGSMITVASLVLSMTLVALTMLSQQLGPRILQLFMEDNLTKATLGVFVATFLFALLLLGATGTGSEGGFVPEISVYVAVALAIVAFGIMIGFVHHIAMNIQADVVVSNLADELNRAIERDIAGDAENVHWLMASNAPAPPEEGNLPEGVVLVAMRCSGYIEMIDEQKALHYATRHDLTIQMMCRPGHFLIQGRPAAAVRCHGEVPEDMDEKIAGVFVVGRRRTRRQQIVFEINALLEVALRALSPGINDPFTALTCVDRLAEAMVRVAEKESEVKTFRDDTGTCRLIGYPQPFSHILNAAFFPIRQAADGNVAVLLHLAAILEEMASQMTRPEQLEAVVQQAEIIQEIAPDTILSSYDRQQIERRCEAVLAAAGRRRRALSREADGERGSARRGETRAARAGA